MAKLTARGFTRAEWRELRFESFTLGGVIVVAIAAAFVSFFALQWFGEQFIGSTWAWLLPLCVDGFAMVCSAAIVRSQSAREGWRERVNEWVGMALALGLSIAGNITHALHEGTDVVSPWLLAAFAASMPVLTAYGIHVLGRTLSRGVSARVMRDAPDEIRFDLDALAAPAPRAARPDRPARTTPAPRAPEAVTVARAPEAPAPEPTDLPAAARARTPEWREVLRRHFDEAIAADATTKPDAKQLQHAAGLEHLNPATPRKAVAEWWAELLQAGQDAYPDEVRVELVGDPAA